MDCFVTDPQDNVLYNEKKKQYDNFSHTTTMKGIYKVCFSNEFSTYTHKMVYLEFRHGEEQPLLEGMSRVTALTQVCERIIDLNVSVSDAVHSTLISVDLILYSSAAANSQFNVYAQY